MNTDVAEVTQTQKMPVLIWSQAGRLELSSREIPQIQHPSDVKIKIHMTGICGTDLAVITGKEPGIGGVIRGHEAVGIVTETGPEVSRLKPGDRVVIDPNESCGKCRFCLRGKRNLCVGPDGRGMPIAGLNKDGTFAPWFVTQESFVHKLPESVSWEAAVLTEPLACVLHNFREAGIRAGDRLLVLGSGPMGLLCQYVGKRTGCITVATEVSAERLTIARSISDFACPPDELDKERLELLLNDEKFDVVIDTTGTQMLMAELWVERGGTIIPFGINNRYRHTLAPTFYVQNAIRMLGAGEYLDTFEAALRFVADVPEISSLVTHRYPLDEYAEAIQQLLGQADGGGDNLSTPMMKTVFVF
ncbi:Sorbitol dehydrogenase [compost metagenome]